jgi:hypothetical protein
VRTAAVAGLSQDLGVGKGSVKRAFGSLQAIDVGKQAVKANYATQKSMDNRWRLKTATDPKRSLYVKPATGTVNKDQKLVTFHGVSGSINIRAHGT